MYQKVVDVAEQIGVTIEKTDNGVCHRLPTRRNILADPLLYIVILSFTKGIFTDCLKHAKICAIDRAVCPDLLGKIFTNMNFCFFIIIAIYSLSCCMVCYYMDALQKLNSIDFTYFIIKFTDNLL